MKQFPNVYTLIAISIGLSIIAFSCVTARTKGNPVFLDAMETYSKGDFSHAEEKALLLLRNPETESDGHYLLTLVYHITGRYADSIRQYNLLEPSYPKRKALAETIVWSYIHLDDIDGALRCLHQYPSIFDDAFRKTLEYSRTHPLSADINSVVELPFTGDALSPYMPGIPVTINGIDTVARLDTGGTWIHVSAAYAEKAGIQTIAKGNAFAGLVSDTVRYGFTDLRLGSAILSNVPVIVHEKSLPSELIAKAFNVELGPIIGTNVLMRFLTTVDGPGKRLIFSERNNAEMRDTHLALLRGAGESVPFAMWQDHYMILRGNLGDKMPVNMFVDTGLVVVDGTGQQAEMMTSVGVLDSWNAAKSEGRIFFKIPDVLHVGKFFRENIHSYSISDKVWKQLGSWGGVRVDTLISWGFLKEYTWTLDFSTHQFIFRK